MSDNRIEALLEAISASENLVAVVGSLNADYTVVVDRLPQPGETVEGGNLTLLPGGKSSNQAAQAALLGVNVAMCGLVGNDANGDFLLDELAKTGADTSLVGRVPGSSGTAFITVDAHAENTIVYVPGSNAQLDVDYVRSCAGELSKAQVMGLCLETPMATVQESARIGHDAGATVLLNCSPLPEDLPRELVSCVDVLLVNETEAAQLSGLLADDAHDAEVLRKTMADLGFSRVIVTLGSKGSMVLEPSGITHVDPVGVEAVDTTGCGDSFMGSVLAGLAADATLPEAAALGSHVAAYAARGRGAQASYGTADDVRQTIASTRQ